MKQEKINGVFAQIALNDRRRPIRSMQNKAFSVWRVDATKNTSLAQHTFHSFHTLSLGRVFVSLIIKFMSFNLDVAFFIFDATDDALNTSYR